MPHSVRRRKEQQKNQTIGQAAIDEAEGENAEAEASLLAANADRQLAKLKFDSTDVRAPIAGTVSGPILDLGSVVAADTTTLATMVVVDPMQVIFIIDQEVALGLKSQAKAQGGAASSLMVMVGWRWSRPPGQDRSGRYAGDWRTSRAMSRRPLESRWRPTSRPGHKRASDHSGAPPRPCSCRGLPCSIAARDLKCASSKRRTR